MISVITSAYNVEKYLGRAIESILNQTFTEFEYIILNDGSTDNTLKIAQQYEAQDERIKVINLEENAGLPNGLNQCIAAAQYEWIALMDSDDISLPTRLETQLAYAENDPEVIVWGTYISHINANDDILSTNEVGPINREQLAERFERGDPVYVMHGTALMRKSVVQAIGGYDTRFFAAEDIELFARMSKHGPILAIPEVLYLYRIHGNSTSMTKFFAQKQFTEYVKLMYHTDKTGEPMPTLEEFLESDKRQPFFTRMRSNMKSLRGLYYRRAGLAYGEKRWLSTAGYMALSTLMDPFYALPRAWKQVFKARVRGK